MLGYLRITRRDVAALDGASPLRIFTAVLDIGPGANTHVLKSEVTRLAHIGVARDLLFSAMRMLEAMGWVREPSLDPAPTSKREVVAAFTCSLV